jgi:hypothetical protein
MHTPSYPPSCTPRPLSSGARFMPAAGRSPVVTIGQFRATAKERGWSEAWIVEQCSGAMDNPRAVSHP